MVAMRPYIHPSTTQPPLTGLPLPNISSSSLPSVWLIETGLWETRKTEHDWIVFDVKTEQRTQNKLMNKSKNYFHLLCKIFKDATWELWPNLICQSYPVNEPFLRSFLKEWLSLCVRRRWSAPQTKRENTLMRGTVHVHQHVPPPSCRN